MAKNIKLKDLINESTSFTGIGGFVPLAPINSTSMTRISDLVEASWVEEDKKKVDRGSFIDEVKAFGNIGEKVYRKTSLQKVAKSLSELAEKARVATLQETDDWFDKVTINKNMKSLGNASGEFTKIAKEANSLQQRMESLYEDIGHILGRYYDLDEAEIAVKEAGEDPAGPQSGGGEEYEKFFRAALKKFGVSEPDKLPDEKKAEFYNYVDANWKGDNESD